MNIDFSIVAAYLALTLFIGLWKSKKISTLKDYALGSQNYSTFAIVATIFATFIGGGATVGIIEQIHQTGLIFGTIFFGQVIQKLIIAKFIAPNLKHFKGSISSGDLLGNVYGENVKRITGVIAFVVSVGMVAAQVSAIGYVLQYYVGLDKDTGIIVGAGIVVIYSALGGMRSVIATDVFQFAILIIAFPLICNLGLTMVGGYSVLISKLPTQHISWPANNDVVFYILPILIYFCIPFEALMAQRLLLAKNASQVKKSMYVCASIEAPFIVVVAIIGLLGAALYPNLQSNLVFPHLVNDILPTGLKGFAIAGILAVIMSTADSNLNTASISFANDILRPQKHSERFNLLVAKTVTFISGAGSIVIAIFFDNILSIISSTLTLWSATVMLPLFLGLLRIKISLRQLYFTFAAGLLTLLFCYFLGAEKFSALFSTLANASAFLFFKLYNDKIRITLFFKSLFQSSLYFIKKGFNFFLSFSFNRFLKSVDRNVEESGAQYKTFGAFVIFGFILPMIMWSNTPDNSDYNLIVYIKTVSALIAFCLIVHQSWPQSMRKFVSLFWYFSILYILPFTSIFMLMANHGELIWWFNLAISIYLVTMLVDWIIGPIIILLGISIGACFGLSTLTGYESFFAIKVNSDNLTSDISYLLLLSLVIGLIFSRNRSYVQNQIIRYKNQINALLEDKIKNRTSELVMALSVKDRFLRNISHELRTPLHALTNISSGLVTHWKKLNEDEKVHYTKELDKSAKRLHKLMKNILDYTDLLANSKKISTSDVDIIKLISKLANSYEHVTYHSALTCLFVKGYEDRLQQAFSEILENSIKHSSDKKVKITITSDYLEVTNKGIGIPKGEEKKIFEPFVESSHTSTNAGGRGLGLAITKVVISQHGWKISAQSKKNITTFKITF